MIRQQFNFWDYREQFRLLMQGIAPETTGEPGPAYTNADGEAVSERLVQAIWAQQLVDAGAMRLMDGRPIRVLETGRWNGSAGPDFRDARLMIGDDPVAGDVEIHLTGDLWRAHDHERDMDYNRVVLHVVLNAGDGQTSDRLHNGERIPRLELEPYIFPDLETIARSVSADDFDYQQPEGVGRCHRHMAESDAVMIADFLDRAGEERLAAKTRRLEAQLGDELQATELEQVFYQSLMMSLGSGPAKTLYYLLAKRTPLLEMMQEVRPLPEEQWVPAFETILLHVAGLAPKRDALAEAPAESRERATQLEEHWRRFEPLWRDRIIPPSRRWLQSTRPVNFPYRRLAGVAVLLARSMRRQKSPLADLLTHLAAGRASLRDAKPTRRRHPLLRELTGWFHVAGDGNFWGDHFSFTAKPSARRMDLIGEGQAASLVFNAMLPAAMLAAQLNDDAALENDVRKLYAIHPPLQNNHITQFMTRRLFGERKEMADLLNTERRRQALFQIFHHCCRGESTHCDACYFLSE